MSLFLLFSLFFPGKNYYYWEDFNLFEQKKNFYQENCIIFPEFYFEIKDTKDIDYLVSLAKKHQKNIIAGVFFPIYENNIRNDYNGVIFVDYQNAEVKYRSKKLPLPFLECQQNFFYGIKENFFYNNSFDIFICSEFFLFPIKKNNKTALIVASSQWTNTLFTFWYKMVMQRIYDRFF